MTFWTVFAAVIAGYFAFSLVDSILKSVIKVLHNRHLEKREQKKKLVQETRDCLFQLQIENDRAQRIINELKCCKTYAEYYFNDLREQKIREDDTDAP